MRRRRLSTAAIAIAVLLLTAVALARPGGGHSYGGGGGGGGGGSSGGGGGSGGGDGVGLLVYVIIQLLFEAPEIGVPLLIVVFFVWWWRSRVESSERGWDTTSSAPEPSFEVHRWQPPEEHAISPRNTLQRLREDDPDFSLIVFEDFLQAFWGELLIAQGSGRTETLMPWLTKRAFDNLPFLGDVDSVTTPIVGAITYRDVEFTGDRVLVRVHIEGMYSARHNGVVSSYWVRDHWRLERARTARSRSPDRVAVFTCPNCGAPAESARTGRCSYCSEIVNDGRFDWVLGNAVRDMSEQRPPQLTSDVAESGTENETVKAPDVAQQLQALAREPSFSHEQFQARVRLAFHEVQTGWRDGDLARIRPWVTDRQFESMRWWLDAYRAAGLRNISTNAITRLETVRVTRDRWYDALTVRVHATGTDYTIDTRGNVVSGSQVRQRPFSEYWTLIRGRSATGPARADKACPRCGAPLAINMAGSCAHCGAHVVSGDFDWVLSRIEQDDAYAG